jgi:hypothetical protein
LFLVAAAFGGGCGSSAVPAELGSTQTPPTIMGGGCAADGQTATCDAVLSRHDGVVDCATGTMTCQGGVWGPCVTSGSVARSVPDPSLSLQSGGGAGAKLGVLSFPSSPSTCVTNPCDPYCQLFNDVPDAAIQPEAGGGGGVGYFTGFGQLPTGNPPSGFQMKADDNGNACSQTACTPANMSTATTTALGSTTSACQEACQFDSHCSGQSCTTDADCAAAGIVVSPSCNTTTHLCNGCVMYTPTSGGSCQGIDLTVPIACDLPNGAHELKLCNRGTQDLPANSNVVCYGYSGGSPAYPSTNCATNADCAHQDPTCMGAATGTSLGICLPSSGTLIDTFNDAIPAGSCVTHHPTTWPSNGTMSVYCNVQQTATSTTVYPNVTTYALPTTTTSAGSWTTTSGAYDVGGTTAQLSFAAGTAGPATSGGASGATGGWSNLGGLQHTTATGTNPTTVDVDDAVNTTYPATSSTSGVTAIGTWSNPNGAWGAAADGAVATATVSSVTASQYATGGAADASLGTYATWVNPSSAAGPHDSVLTSATLTKSGGTTPNAALYLAYVNTFNGQIPAGATLIGATVTVYWSADSTSKLSALVELHNAAGTTVATGASANAASTSAINPTTWTFTKAQVAGLAPADVVNNTKLVRFYASNGSSSSSYGVYVDAVSVAFAYVVSPAPALSLTNFAVTIPSGATVTSVVVTAGVSESASLSTASFALAAYKSSQSTLIASTSATPTTTVGSPALSLTLTGGTLPSATDLANANFKVLVTPTDGGPAAAAVTAGATTLTGFTANVDYVSVVVNYTEANNQSVILTTYGLQSLIPSTAVIDSIKTEVDVKIDSSNSKATVAVQAYKGGVVSAGNLIGTGVSVNPTTSYATYSATYSNTSGGVAWSDLANGQFIEYVTASTSGSGFRAYIDMVRVTVTYTNPATSAMYLSGFGFNVASGTLSLTLTAGWDVTAASSLTQICFKPYNQATGASLGSATCTTYLVSPPTSIMQQSATFAGLAPADIDNLQVKVYGTHNPGATPTTVNVDYVEAQVSDGVMSTSGVTECDLQNNWSVAKANPPLLCASVATYTPVHFSRVFPSSCPAGTRARWQLFGWDTTDPSTSYIEFRFRSFDVGDGGACGTLAGVYSGTSPTPIVTAESTPYNTQFCSVTQSPAVSFCPQTLATYLGGQPASDLPCLQMDVNEAPSADGSQAPSLNDWTVTYDCLPSE